MNEATEEKGVWYGIADCHGVESFTDDATMLPLFALRAMLNPQRHAVTYRIELNDFDEKAVKNMLKASEFKYALTYMISTGAFAVPEHMKESAKLIPNDELDPYWSKPDEEPEVMEKDKGLDQFLDELGEDAGIQA